MLNYWRPIFGRFSSNKRPRMSKSAIAERELEALKLTVKYFGYDLARALTASLPIGRRSPARYVGLESKASTQADMQSDWIAHWCAELKIPINMHRKLWEYGYVLQALHDRRMLRANAKGLGFGCGLEPLPSLFAERGIDVTMTDQLPSQAKAAGWVHTNQHLGSLDQAFYPHLTSREAFDRHVSLRYVDMNAIDPTLTGFDFCWSICALEHLGSIENGLAFIVNAMDTLNDSGVAVHTTEFSFADDEITLENDAIALFQRQHFEIVAARLRSLGYAVAPLNFDIGNLPLDRFIDIPPYPHQMSDRLLDAWGPDIPHLKLTIDGFLCTCFGLIVWKNGLPSEVSVNLN